MVFLVVIILKEVKENNRGRKKREQHSGFQRGPPP